ncbi:MAG: SRPBCC family protein [Chloroflexia bacterium]|nr:SRPBCC family protein [Chloroflexia bacterium]
MEIRKHSGIYTLEITQLLPVSIEKAWDFFSSPENLDILTPKEFGFKITSRLALKMYQGQIITYKIDILPFIKTNWVTEITTVVENSYFIDEQRFGPYKMWHHEHFFVQKGKQVEMTDKITFALPMGFLGKLSYLIFVKKRLMAIFNYLAKKVQEIFTNSG